MKTMIKLLASFAMGIGALTACANDTDYGPFGSSDDWTYEAGNKDRTATPVIGLSSGVFVGANKASEGDCIAAYRKDKNVICGLGRVDSAGKTGIKFEVNSGVEVHFKLWIASSGTAAPKIYDIDSTCDFTIPATDLPTVDLGELTVTLQKEFKPGNVSCFPIEGVGAATLVGVSEVAWRDFSTTDYYGTKTFVHANIVDAEKTAADDSDDYWCYPMSDMNALYLTGWAGSTGFTTVDDMVGYFRSNPTLLWRGETPGRYESVFEWYWQETGIDLEHLDDVVTDGIVDNGFCAILRSLLDDGSHVVRVNVDYDEVLYNKKWKGTSVLHGVLCVGYVADDETLKALFIIDPDNDQYTGTGGTAAPNSIMYCPVSWNAEQGQYVIEGVWGQAGRLAPYWEALKVMDAPPEVYTVKFNKNGGTGTMADQKFTEGVEQALTENAFRKSGYLFAGWKDQNGKAYEDGEAIVATSDLTLAAQWVAIVVSCAPDNAAYAWRATGDGLLAGSFNLTCNTDWTATVSDPSWIVLFGTEGSGDGRIEYSLTKNNDTKGRNGTITVTSKVDGTKKAVFSIKQGGRPKEPTQNITSDGVLVGVDMEGYDTCTISNTVVAIGANAFACIDEAYSIRVPASVTEIRDSAFAGCANLTNVVFDGNAPTPGNDVFKDTPDGLVVTVRNDKTGWPEEGESWPNGDAYARTVVVLKNYIVSFDWNGWEDGPAIEEIVVEPGAVCPLPRREIFSFDLDSWSNKREGVRPGYTFDGWNETGLMEDGRFDWDSYIPESSVTLKAIWWGNDYKFKFNANGGKPTSQDINQTYGGPWKAVVEPTLANAVFDGWWTAKTGGERIDMGEVCTVVGKLGGTTTIYAHWRKMFKAAVKDGMVSEDVENYAANITVLSGTDLYLEAADKSAANMEFSKWTVSPATANLGENFDPRSSVTSFTMPDAAVTFTANYLAKPGSVEVSAFEQNATANEDGEPQGIEWSDDGKVWTPVGGGSAYPVKTGKVALQFRSTDPRWTVPAKATYQIVEDETSPIKVVATRVTIVEVAAECEQFGASGTVSMSPKNGQVLPGKPVTLTAKPGKDTVFAYWLVDGEKVGYTATFKYAPDADCTVTAVFRLKSAVEDPVLDQDDVVPSANAMVGVAFEAQVPLADAAYPAKFSAKGLPAGLKIDAASGVISGVPTKVGDYTATISVAGGVNTKAKSSITLPISIKPLPAWAQGTFTGYVLSVFEEDEEDMGYTVYGSVSMTVSAAGKITGKMLLNGTSYSFSAASYGVTSVTDEEVEEAMSFAVLADAKAGKVVFPVSLEVSKAEAPEGEGEDMLNGSAYGEFDALDEGGAFVYLFRTIWKDKATAAAAKSVLAEYMGVYTVSLAADEDGEYGSGYLSLTVGKDGNVKATGKLADGTSVSMTSPLMYDAGCGYFAYFHAAPSAYKGGAFALTVSFEFDEDLKVLGNAPGIAQWTSRNPQATGDYGEGFDYLLEFTGAYYNKLETLNEYYKSLQFETADPLLRYTYKETYEDEDTGKKVTETDLLDANAAGVAGELTVTVNEKGTAFVVPKATKPVKDSESGEWQYDGANDGALSLSFTQATGIFKGSYTFWYDYVSAYDATTDKETLTHTSKKVSFEGILVQGADSMDGFYLWDVTGAYDDPKTDKPKTYKYKESHPVSLVAE